MRLLVALALCVSCTGSIGAEGQTDETPTGSSPTGSGATGTSTGTGSTGTKPGSTPSASACASNKTPSYAPGVLRRLTQEEYQSSLRDLFGAEAFTASGSSVLVTDATVNNGYAVEAHAVTASQIEALLGAADTLSTVLTSKPERLAALSPCLAQAPITDVCVQGFIERTGRRMFRRPLRTDEVATFQAAYKDGLELSATDGVRALLFTMLQWADFLYRPEILGPALPEAPGAYKLTAFELATRLSFMLVGSTPDDKLLDAAASGALDKDAGLAAEVDRLLADPRAPPWALRFFQQWLRLDGIPSPGQSDKFLNGISRTGIVDEARKELERFFVFQAFGARGSYKDLMTSPVSFVSSATPSLAKVYEIPAASGDGKQDLPRDRRGGLLTRAGIVMTPNVQTSIPHRGDLLVTRLLCSPVPPPNVDPAKIKPPAPEATKTARQGWEALLAGLPECAGCHAILNPLGYVLENYDSLGRYRTLEPIIDGKGVEIARLPIDASIDMAWPDGSPRTRANGVVELSAAMAQNRGAQTCFARQWLEFEYARKSAAEDTCLLDDLAGAAAADGGLQGMFRRLALAPATRVNRPGKP